MPVTAGPIYPGIKDGLVFAIDPANKDSWTGPTSATVDSLTLYNPVSGSIYNDTSGSYGNDESFDFDGTDSYVEVNGGNLISSTNPFTISLWFKADSLNSGCLMYFKNDLSRAFFIQVLSTGNVNFRSRYSIWIPGETADSSISTGAWTHYALVYNGNGVTTLSNFTAFLNGSPSTLQAGLNSAHQYYNTANYIGRSAIAGVGNNYFDGQMGPTMIYNRTLSSSEILENYNRVKGRFGL